LPKLVRDGNTLTLVNSGTNLELTVSPEKTLQLVPGPVQITAYPNGGYDGITYNWDATFYNGESAAHLITGSSNTVTVTTYQPLQSIKVFVTASDLSMSKAFATSIITSSNATPITPPSSTQLSTATGVTSASISFGTASGGFGTISYTMALAGTGTLSTTSGRSATLSNLTDGDISRIRLTCADEFNQTATSDYVVGIGVPAVFDEGARWNTVQEVNCTTIGTGSATVAADAVFYSFITGSITFGAVAAITGGRGTITLDSSGFKTNLTSGTGTSITSTILLSIANYAPMEHILVDAIIEVPSMATGRNLAISIGDANHYRAGDSYGIQINPASLNTGAIVTRRWQSSALQTGVNLVASTTITPKTWAVQLLLAGQIFCITSIKEDTDYMEGPKIGNANLMRGTWSASAGGNGVASSASDIITAPLSSLKFQISCINGSFTPIVKKVRARRLTRPPST